MTRLSERERDVCNLLLLGRSNKEVAEILYISHRTVEMHRENIFKKFKVRNVVELVRAVYGIGVDA